METAPHKINNMCSPHAHAVCMCILRFMCIPTNRIYRWSTVEMDICVTTNKVHIKHRQYVHFINATDMNYIVFIPSSEQKIIYYGQKWNILIGLSKKANGILQWSSMTKLNFFFFESFLNVCTLIDFDEKITMMEFWIDLENKVNCLMSLYFIDLEWQFFFIYCISVKRYRYIGLNWIRLWNGQKNILVPQFEVISVLYRFEFIAVT